MMGKKGLTNQKWFSAVFWLIVLFSAFIGIFSGVLMGWIVPLLWHPQ